MDNMIKFTDKNAEQKQIKLAQISPIKLRKVAIQGYHREPLVLHATVFPARHDHVVDVHHALAALVSGGWGKDSITIENT